MQIRASASGGARKGLPDIFVFTERTQEVLCLQKNVRHPVRERLADSVAKPTNICETNQIMSGFRSSQEKKMVVNRVFAERTLQVAENKTERRRSNPLSPLLSTKTSIESERYFRKNQIPFSDTIT
jgi:hypothetical protein